MALITKENKPNVKIFNDGTFEEIYNGPGKNIWELIKDRKHTKNSLHAISVSALLYLLLKYL